MTVKLGVMAPFVDGLITSGDFLREYAATLEACGVESVFTVEHVVVAEDYEPLYPYNAEGRMASAACSRSTVRCWWTVRPVAAERALSAVPGT